MPRDSFGNIISSMAAGHVLNADDALRFHGKSIYIGAALLRRFHDILLDTA